MDLFSLCSIEGADSVSFEPVMLTADIFEQLNDKQTSQQSSNKLHFWNQKNYLILNRENHTCVGVFILWLMFSDMVKEQRHKVVA